MIITFHFAVCFFQRIWESITMLLESANNNQGTDIINSDQNTTEVDDDDDDNNGRQNHEDNSPTYDSSRIEPQRHNTIISEHNHILPSLGTEYEQNSNIQEVTEEDIVHTISFGDQIDINIRKLIYDVKPTFECKCDEKGMRFIPPVYIQRYIAIESILKEPCWANTIKKIVDFGCSELKFEDLYLTKLPGIEEIIAVDIDEDLLRYNSCKLKPTIPDYLTRKRRPPPLIVKIYCGSVGHTNEALVGCDAVVAIELIEHLYPPDLENLPFTVFGYIRPSIAIFTTPNAEFNVLFDNFSGFRHDDHKFEWTRHEFEAWANNLVTRYPEYSVSFQGVGPGPAGTDHLGCCSQMATFVKVFGTPTTEEFERHTQDGHYELINEYEYPVEERTREEIIRDDAIGFINNSILMNTKYNEHVVKEIHLKTVMERSKCYNREKLKTILAENNWQVEINENGHEVIIVPDSESEDDTCSNRSEEYQEQEQYFDNEMEFSNVDENWDSDEKESNKFLNYTSNSVFVNTTSSNDHYKNASHDFFVYSSDKVGSGSEASVSNLDVSTSKCRSDTLSEKESVTDCSVYETPQIGQLSSQQLSNKSTYDQNNIVEDCKKALDFGTPDIYNECKIDKTSHASGFHSENEKSKSFCSLSNPTMGSESSKNESSFSHDNVVSPFNSSIYTTPCCSKLHKNNFPKSLSLQELNGDIERPSMFTELSNLPKLPDLTLDQRDKISKSVEGFKTQDSCDTQKNSTNDSKVIDSGYLDSYSGQNMDLDLTPEQFDDIETESDGNGASSGSASPLEPAVHILHVIDDVENGDVVNNNRDGEGNNMVADIEEELLGFEAQIEEVNNEIPNLAAGYLQEINHFRNESLSPGERSVDMEVESQEFEAKIEGTNIDSDLTSQNAFSCNERSPAEQPNISEKSFDVIAPIKETNENVSGFVTTNEPSILIDQAVDNSSNKSNLFQVRCFVLPTLCDHTILKPSLLDHVLEENNISKPSSVIELATENKINKSNLCIARSNSECYLNSPKSAMTICSINGSINKNNTNHESSELTKYNSLTTVIDGCSKFSECSLVQPIHIFPKWMRRIDVYEFETCEKICGDDNALPLQLPSSEQVIGSLSSGFESATSLSSEAEDCPFPRWLLDINLLEVENHGLENRISETSVLEDIDIFEDFPHPHYHDQVDTRGGGDPDSMR